MNDELLSVEQNAVQCKRCGGSFKSFADLACHGISNPEGQELQRKLHESGLGSKPGCHVGVKASCKLPDMGCQFSNHDCPLPDRYKASIDAQPRNAKYKNHHAVGRFNRAFQFEMLYHHHQLLQTGTEDVRLPCICGLVFPNLSTAPYPKLIECPGRPYLYWEWVVRVMDIDVNRADFLQIDLRQYNPLALDDDNLNHNVRLSLFDEVLRNRKSKTLVVGIDRMTGPKETRQNFLKFWKRLAKDYIAVAGHDDHTHLFLVLPDVQPSYLFPIRPGTED